MALTSDQLIESGLRHGLVDAETLGRLRLEARRQRADLMETVAAHFRFPVSALYRALAEERGHDPLDGQNRVIADWTERFPAMPVALIDTFTSDVTLHDLSPEQIDQLRSFRIDSGDEVAVGQKVIRFLQNHDVDPRTRTLFFSNSLTPHKIAELQGVFSGKIGVAFGIGGNLVNNMGLDAQHSLPGLNIVAKAVEVNGAGTVKLSDDEGKHMGSPEDVARYKELARRRLGHKATGRMVAA